MRVFSLFLHQQKLPTTKPHPQAKVYLKPYAFHFLFHLTHLVYEDQLWGPDSKISAEHTHLFCPIIFRTESCLMKPYIKMILKKCNVY